MYHMVFQLCFEDVSDWIFDYYFIESCSNIYADQLKIMQTNMDGLSSMNEKIVDYTPEFRI